MSAEGALIIKGAVTGALYRIKAELPVTHYQIRSIPNNDATPDDYGDIEIVFDDGVVMTVKFEITEPICKHCLHHVRFEDVMGERTWIISHPKPGQEDLDRCTAYEGPHPHEVSGGNP